MNKKIRDLSETIFINGRFLNQEITGIQRFSYEICKALIDKEPGVIILAPRKIRKEYRLNCRIIRFGIFNGILWEQIDLPVYLTKHKNPLLINFGSPGPLFYSNRIVTVHDLSFYVNPGWFRKSYRLYYRFATPVFTRLSKKVITVSEFSKKEIMRLIGVPDEKIIVIHNAVSSDLMIPAPVRAGGRGKYILSVASMDPRKNIVRLVDACKMAGIDQEIKLVLAGKSDPIFNMQFSDEILACSVGYVPDNELSSLYENATLFIYPSFYEGFGLPPLEAMSLGCPVILSDIPVFREIFADAVHYVDPFEIVSIRDGIMMVIKNEPYRKELIRRGYERVKMYSWERSADKIVSIIQSIK